MGGGALILHYQSTMVVISQRFPLHEATYKLDPRWSIRTPPPSSLQTGQTSVNSGPNTATSDIPGAKGKALNERQRADGRGWGDFLEDRLAALP